MGSGEIGRFQSLKIYLFPESEGNVEVDEEVVYRAGGRDFFLCVCRNIHNLELSTRLARAFQAYITVHSFLYVTLFTDA